MFEPPSRQCRDPLHTPRGSTSR
ncbi:hypothetical protein FRZ00_34250 [Streptomyces mobaraensis]|uniref:Uncharacterized protein n=1 Tax=Streptomyces mobaraensis TaxID=35621 RepID=A0A5N5VWV6_STRMB|nr:hypothetical protein FRZ00_34250 [Streptomyces mobaraensis]